MEDGEAWDRRYATTHRLWSREPDPALVELVSPLDPGRAVDLGAGEGRNSLWLAQRGWAVTAVDGSQVALQRLTAAASAAGIQVATAVADIGEFLARGDSFELVVIANVHSAPADRETMLDRAAAAVRPGGHLLLVGHHVDSHGRAGPQDPSRLYTEAALATALPGLRTLLLERRERAHGADLETPMVDVVLWAEAPPGGSG